MGTLVVRLVSPKCCFKAITGKIHLLPALPGSWENGEIKGLCGRGGITVDMEWKAGTLSSAKITSKYKQKIRVRYQDSVKTISLKAGETVTL